MKVTILGAAGGEVTGSCYLLETSQAKVLIDCGLFQGGERTRELNRSPLGEDSSSLHAVLLTHGHLDHTGRLPLLTKTGFTGPVYATPATIDMTSLILRDSAKIQVQDTERQNRHRMRAGEPPVLPLYSTADVDQIFEQFRPAPYHQPTTVAPGIQAIFVDAGHMLGSSSIQLLITDGAVKRTIVFSGDLGPKGTPILRDFEPFSAADVVIMEATYGDRDHQPFPNTLLEFIDVLKQAIEAKGKVFVPTFAVGRAQLLTALLAGIFRKKLLPPFPIFLDSPMAIEASNIYDRHPELFDDELVSYMKEKPLAQDLTTMRMTATPEESRQINSVPGPCLVMAGAGMCNAGRILHHLRHNLWNPAAHVLIVGYQSRGTLGRLLVDRAPRVNIFGETIAVKAQVHTLGGFSAHAGQSDLLGWFSALAPVKPRVILTHGEEGPRQALAALLAKRHGLTAKLPALGEVIEVA